MYEKPALKKAVMLAHYVKFLQKLIKSQENISKITKENIQNIKLFKEYF